MLSKLSMDLFLCPLLSPTKSETNIYLRFCISLSINKKLNIKVLTYFYLFLQLIRSTDFLFFHFCFIFVFFIWIIWIKNEFSCKSRVVYACFSLSDTNLSMAHIRVILVLINFLYSMEYQRIHFFPCYFFFFLFLLVSEKFPIKMYHECF